MNSRSLILCFLMLPFLFHGQERLLTKSSKDSINGKPKMKGSLGANIKLNGYYDFFGGLQGSETFNVGLINVFGTDDSPSFNMDLYQTQLKFEGSIIDNKEKEIYAIVEADFWGGNGHMRLRKAYVESRHMQIGQNWHGFGDEILWPNIMEWEGPPSGIWVRSPQIKYFNNFRDENWSYEFNLSAPITNYISFEELDLNVDEAYQITPDLSMAIKRKYDWGHLRLSSILRNVRFNYEGEKGDFLGYGASFTGIYTNERKNNIQFQIVGGRGITAYMTSIAGLGYDGYLNNEDDFVATPSFGGWMSYEYFFTPSLHSTVVFGYTQYWFDDLKEFRILEDEVINTIYVNGDFSNYHYYGIINLMYSPFTRMTVGIELDYGYKNIALDGFVNEIPVTNNKGRDAMRMSFGFMFYL